MTSIRNIRKKTLERIFNAGDRTYVPKFRDFSMDFLPKVPGFALGKKPENAKLVTEIICSDIMVKHMSLPVRRFDSPYSDVRTSALTLIRIRFVNALVKTAVESKELLSGDYTIREPFIGDMDSKTYICLDLRLRNNPISHSGGGYEVLEDKIVIWFN